VTRDDAATLTRASLIARSPTALTRGSADSCPFARRGPQHATAIRRPPAQHEYSLMLARPAITRRISRGPPRHRDAGAL